MSDAELSTATIEAYRNAAISQGYSPRTIEDTIAVVREIASFCGLPIDVGKKLYIPRPNPDVPHIERIDAIYRHVSRAAWPDKLSSAKRCDWWRAFVAIASWTGFRLGDLKTLSVADIDGEYIRLNAAKTRRFGRASIAVPVTMTIRRHLGMVDRLYPTTLFGLTTCHKQLRRELGRIAQTAGVKYVSPQGFRRFAINQWTHADSLAGQLIQGQSLGSMNHYLDVARHLVKVADDVVMPKAFFTDAELAQASAEEHRLLSFFRRSKSKTRELILKIAKELA